MRRDLELDFDPTEVVRSPPDRSQLKEMFRRFEFRNLLNRVDELDEALPAAQLTPTGVEVPWREGELPALDGVGIASVCAGHCSSASANVGRSRSTARSSCR